jgi:DNA polymerase
MGRGVRLTPTMRLDWETISNVDLLVHGVYRYVESPYCDAVLASYRIGDGPLRRWRRGQPCPEDIRAHVAAGGLIRAHNAAFERLIWWHVMCVKHGWPKPALDRFRDTAVEAAAMSLPRSLDRLGAALDLKIQKDKRGKALMKIHSIPVGRSPDGSPIWHAW